MKKTFLEFGNINPYKIPRMKSRRNPCRIALFKAGGPGDEEDEGEDGGGDADSAEVKAIKKIGKQVESFKTALGEKADAEAIKALQEKVEDLAKNIATMQSDDIVKTLKEINDANEKMWKQIAEMQEAAQVEKEKTEGKAKKGDILKSEDVAAFVKATFGDDAAHGTKTSNPAKVTLKAAETFGYATFFEGADGTDITAFTGRMVDPTLNERKRKRNMILDHFQIRTINVPTLIYLIKVEDGDDVGSSEGDSGSAAWIASGEIKPKRSFRVTTGVANAKKVAIFGTVEDKLLRDVPSLENWIREDFVAEIREAYNDGLLNNDPGVDADAPLGLKTNAVQYSATPGYNNAFTANTTNYIDQLFAMFAFMAYNKEEAGMAFVASDVYYRIMHLKDSEQRYQNNNLVYTDALGRLFIGGVEIIWVDEEDIPGTNVMVVTRDLGFKIYNYGPLVFERGLNGEDFRYDRTSFRGYQEVLSFIPENRENSVLYDTWANVKAAIEA